jgi:hypothetical protein
MVMIGDYLIKEVSFDAHKARTYRRSDINSFERPSLGAKSERR